MHHFTIAAFDNFDHEDRSTLAGLGGCHDTAITLFQENPETPIIKPSKSDVPLTNVKDLNKLPCQQITKSTTDRVPKLSDESTPENELFESKDYLSSQKFSEFVMNELKNSGLVDTTENIPTWAGICSLLTTKKFP